LDQLKQCFDECLTLIDEWEYLGRKLVAMKQLFTLATSIALCASVHAQITIGQNEMPHSGDELFRTQATINPFVNYGATGAGHTWNFGSLSAAGEESTEYVSVSSTNLVYALVYADIFFNPNRANHANSGTDIAFSDLLPIGNAYTFRHQSASAYTTVGYGAEVSNIPLPIIFDEHDVVYELPLNYGNSSVSHSSWKINLPTLAYYGYMQTRQNQVDGWGSITTPSGTFDALRVKTTITAKDTISIDTLSLGFTIDRPTTREYKWLAQGIRVPVLQINTVEIFGAEVVTGTFFYDQPHTITVQQPLADLLCAGSQVTVPYDRTGVYNSGGLFVPSNVFRAQLSDANGDFTNAVNIGSVTSTSSGSINATIPANTPMGSGYRIRVVSTSPAFIGADNGFDIAVSTTPVALVTADGATTFCAGGTVELMADAVPGLSFQWFLDGDAITDATGPSWETDAPGSYSVQVGNACGNDVSEAIDVVVNPLPVHQQDLTELLACNGDAVNLVATNTSGQTVLSYQWMLYGAPIADATSAELATMDAGEYTLEVSNITTGCSFTTATVTVTTETVASPVLTAASAPAFCEGGTVLLNAGGQASDYQWMLDGATITGATGNSLEVDASGAYAVWATGDLGCSSLPSNVVLVEVLPAPDAPVITASSLTSFCEGGMVTLAASGSDDVSFLWSNGSTGEELDVTTSGSYSVEAVAANGCSTSAVTAMEVTVLALPDAPVITELDGVLNASGAGSFQWAFNGVDIADATDAAFTPEASGVYTVTVTDANGCSSTSEDYAFINTGVAQVASAQATVSPNPSTGIFSVTLPGAKVGDRFSIFDATGKLVLEGTLQGIRSTMDLSGQISGLYLLRTEGRQVSSVVRIVLN
jgi:hypothetical protein